MPLSPEQKKALRVAKILDKGEFAMVEELDAIDAEFEVIKDDISIVKEDLTAKVDEALIIANETQKMEGKKGEQGIQGLKGDKGDKGIDGKNGKDGLNGLDGSDGKDGLDGKDGVDGINGTNGKDGSSDTGEQIIDKINLDQTSLIDFSKIDTEPFDRQFNAFKKDVLNIPRGGGAVGGSSSTSTSGGVTSVTATNSTLTISPTTGAVLAGINLSNANTWTGTQTILKAGIGTTITDGFVYSNTTAATNGAQQVSPAEHFSGRGWNSGGAGSSQSIDFRKYLIPIQGVDGATGKFVTQISRNGAAYSEIFSQSTTGEIVQNVLSGVSATTGYELSGTFSNGTTDTTQHMKFSNAGSNTWLTFYFSGVQKGAYGVDSSGVMRFYTSGNRYLFHSGVTGSSLLAEIYSGGFYNVGGNFNAGRVTAGSAVTSPPATFTNYGSTALQTTVITTPTTLTDSYTQVIVDCSSYNVCTGTPSQTACSTYTGSGEATCISHLPCTWYAGDSCSAFNGDVGTCNGTSGCSADTSSCSPYNSDQTTCEAADDSYGGNCTWDAGTNTCPAQDCTTCAGAGCTPNLGGDCSAFSDGGGDGTMCYAAPCGACSYDSPTGNCSGSYFTSCDGDNTTPSCNGTFYTGNCSGTYGTACTGTATCTGYGDETSCEAETGCSWTSGVAITMPASPIEKTYWIAKDYTSGTLRILPNSGQTINNTTSITSSSTTGVGWMLTWIDSKSNWYIMNKH